MDMSEALKRARVLIEALPYMMRFRDKVIVIKLGGAAMNTEKALDEFLADVVFMEHVGMRPVIVHGGGPMVSARMKEAGIPVEFVGGLRKTSPAAMRIVQEVFAGLNREIVATIERLGGRAIGFPRPGIIPLVCSPKTVMVDGRECDLGRVGKVDMVAEKILEAVLAEQMISVVSPVGFDGHDYYNVNADEAATMVAEKINAEKLIFMSDIPGILADPRDENTLIRVISPAEVRKLIADGVVSGGMLPKVQACIEALDCGVRRTHIVDGRLDHALLLEIFTHEGVGTLVTHEDQDLLGK